MNEKENRDSLYKSLNDYCFSHDDNCTECAFSSLDECPLNDLVDKIIGEIYS